MPADWDGNNIPSGFKSKIVQFFNKNKLLVYALPLLIILIVVLIILYSNRGIGGNIKDRPAGGEALDTGQIGNLIEEIEDKVEVLPNVVRPVDQQQQTAAQAAEKSDDAVLYNPFEQPMVLSGILYAENGNSVAIIETSEKSYIVRKGDSVGTSWKVEEITDNTVVLKAGEKETTLSILKNEHIEK
ncbi:MAG: hypothetical protein HPY74_01370 [Firmicutes bacterium]|nr:hypothetical protein [Bacillota bacterium]NSW89327.1 hypothetical protein [Bacillota bacterium]